MFVDYTTSLQVDSLVCGGSLSHGKHTKFDLHCQANLGSLHPGQEKHRLYCFCPSFDSSKMLFPPKYERFFSAIKSHFFWHKIFFKQCLHNGSTNVKKCPFSLICLAIQWQCFLFEAHQAPNLV